MKTTALGIVGTFLVALACAACGGDEIEGGGAAETTATAADAPVAASDPAAESDDFGFEALSKATVRRSGGGLIEVRVSGASYVTYEIDGLPAGIVLKDYSDTGIALAFGSNEPELGEHAITVRAKNGSAVRERSITLVVADDSTISDAPFAYGWH